jgi:hypothetical protein
VPDDPLTGADLFAPRIPPRGPAPSDAPGHQPPRTGAPAPPEPPRPEPPRRRTGLRLGILALAALLLVAVVAWLVVIPATGRTPAAPPAPAAPRPAAATPEPVPDPGPGTAPEAAPEVALATAVPTTVQGCAPSAATAPALATLVCTSGTASVVYEAYPDAATATAVWEARAAGAGGQPGRCGADPQAHTDAYHRGDPTAPVGRLLCHQQPDGAYLTWTQDSRPTVLSTVLLPGDGQVHHEVHDRWGRDEFGPWDDGRPVARVGCADDC